MNCDDAGRLLQDYATRELTPGQRRLVDEHLLGCEECRRELALMSVVVSGLDTQPVLEPSPGFSGRVLAGLPRQRSFVPGPLWALVLVPVLGGLIYLFRGQLTGGLAGLLERVPDLSGVTMQQLAIVPLAAVGLGLAMVAAVGAYCWRVYSESG